MLQSGIRYIKRESFVWRGATWVAGYVTINILCIYNRGEYVNTYVQKLCTKLGIELQHTIPYTPQQNEFAE